jgi:hypothetical protein
VLLRRAYFAIGLVLVMVGLAGLGTLGRLVQAYMAKPDARNGGIVLMSQFIHISYAGALVGFSAALVALIVGILLGIFGSRKPRQP